MFLPIKRLALSASLIGLLLCLTACKKENIEKPAADRDEVIKTTVGKEFSIWVYYPLCPGTWFLMVPQSIDPHFYPVPDKCVEFVRRESVANEQPREPVTGEGSESLWVFRAIAPGQESVIMAYIDGASVGFRKILVKVAPSENGPAKVS